MFIILLFAVSLIFGSTSVVNLSGVVDGSLVKIQWKTTTETNIKEFIIEKSSNNITFESFTTEIPKGSNSSYAIIDSNIYSKNTTLYYRIVVEDYDGTKITSETISVTINTAGISATWGSIKAMFR
ncbi:MAG: hypothetical protein GPJ51_10860 [Candidatus Heimdallarchaeota archaeon]|nr:hypothetical protein [Candidatus Heimdallarchaeota archaeon]